MRTTALKSMLLALAALLMASSCNSNIFSEEVPGHPLFQVTEDVLDFGRVELHQPVSQQIRVRNLGPEDSKMYVYYFVEGDPAFRLDPPEKEIVLTGTLASHAIQVGYLPERTGEVEGTLVIFHADRTLTDNINVKTHRVQLIGNAGFECEFPRSPFALPETRRAGESKDKVK